ncbi:hypothetical protein RHMOL_Rhmol12G0073200 [Rhododendron molle]|uniref:Uncharacterized protein n=1 Tax=Rhododendron molle TaxID=49168 RepID=A0ACC0LFG4_RHOML|nr:hypothetical protein RHMOL_Rhmol12G0073200 [Rhododendron molle]
MERLCSSTSDIVSDLPDNILEKILVLMPIQDAVRISVLSKKWRRLEWAGLLDGLPVLENLHMGGQYVVAIPTSKDDEVADGGLRMVSSDFYLKQLRKVEMRFVSGTTPELHIMKLLLAYSPKLEIMVVKPHLAKVTDGGLRILKELSQFQRLSPKAKITYKHPNVQN